MQILGMQGDSIALVESERLTGDQNGDGDSFDLDLAVYDDRTRSLRRAGLALPVFLGLPQPPEPHRGCWAVHVDEGSQGESDLNEDGDLDDAVLFVFDPETGVARNLGDLTTPFPRPFPEVEPFVLFEEHREFLPDRFFQVLWRYDPLTGRLETTGLTGSAQYALGERLVVAVDEESFGADLDGNFALDSVVTVLFDVTTGQWESLGIDSFPLGPPLSSRLLLGSRESAAHRDWNGDGDRRDVVLHVWDEREGSLSNTGLAAHGFVPFGAEA